MAQSDYKTNDIELLRDLVERADKRVEAQLQTAIAADARAMTFAGFLAAAAAVLGGAAASVLTGTVTDHRIGQIALWAALVTLVGMALAIAAARPRRFFSPGVYPKKWRGSIASGDGETERLTSVLADYDHRIEENERIMAANGATIVWSAAVVMIGYLACGASIALCC